MAATWKWYGLGLLGVAKGLIDFDTDSFKVMLTTATYRDGSGVNQDTDQFRSTPTTNEVGASGTYAAGGGALSNVGVTYDGTSNEVRIRWDDVSFTSATITARTAVIYKARGGAASADDLVAYASETADVTSTAGTFTVDLPDPTLKITAAT